MYHCGPLFSFGGVIKCELFLTAQIRLRYATSMTRRPGDKTPPPPGGRAAERLRQFEQARFPKQPPKGDDAPGGKPTKPRSRKKTTSKSG